MPIDYFFFVKYVFAQKGNILQLIKIRVLDLNFNSRQLEIKTLHHKHDKKIDMPLDAHG